MGEGARLQSTLRKVPAPRARADERGQRARPRSLLGTRAGAQRYPGRDQAGDNRHGEQRRGQGADGGRPARSCKEGWRNGARRP